MKIEDWFKSVYTQDVVEVLILGDKEDREEMIKAIQERFRKDWKVDE